MKNEVTPLRRAVRLLPPGPPRVPSLAALVLALVLALLGAPRPAFASDRAADRASDRNPGQTLAQAQELLDSGRPQAALPLLDALLRKEPGNARALLLRSTARFLTDDIAGGTADLDLSLELDPRQRQAWLNKAALAIADKKYDAAFTALSEAEKLDPQASDNDLNLGAVLLLQGKLQPASDRFGRYLARHPRSAEPRYLVASNYALTGYAAFAIEHLRQAIEIDERSRVRARTDPNFAGLYSQARFQELLAADTYRLPPGAHTARRVYDVPYDQQDGMLVNSVLGALRTAGERHDPRLETTADWALIWGELRIKLSRTKDGKGLVEVSAPVERMSAAEWQRRSDKVLHAITIELYSRQLSNTKRRP
jgi:tetratricopeptide (TPR) repeat protein